LGVETAPAAHSLALMSLVRSVCGGWPLRAFGRVALWLSVGGSQPPAVAFPALAFVALVCSACVLALPFGGLPFGVGLSRFAFGRLSVPSLTLRAFIPGLVTLVAWFAFPQSLPSFHAVLAVQAHARLRRQLRWPGLLRCGMASWGRLRFGALIFLGGFIMLAFFSSGSGLAAVSAFALCWLVLAVAVGCFGLLRSASLSLLQLAAARASIRRLRRSRLLPSGRSQVFVPSRLCRRAHWGLQFPLLWALRGRWVRWQSSRRFAALCRSRAG
jgi:hypothetical protein